MININIANFYAIGIHVEMVNPQDLLKEFTLFVPNEAEGGRDGPKDHTGPAGPPECEDHGNLHARQQETDRGGEESA